MHTNEFPANPFGQISHTMLLEVATVLHAGETSFLPPPVHLLTNNTVFSRFRFPAGHHHLPGHGVRTHAGMSVAACGGLDARRRKICCRKHAINCTPSGDRSQGAEGIPTLSGDRLQGVTGIPTPSGHLLQGEKGIPTPSGYLLQGKTGLPTAAGNPLQGAARPEPDAGIPETPSSRFPGAYQ